ncbi:MAG: hypothetical protein AB8G17_11630 [Gammaproteobacteria bacterium]
MSEPHNHVDDEPLPERNRAQVLRDVVVFQLKLVVDGLRDFLLIPTAGIIGLYSVVLSRRPGEPFYRLLRAGHATERWIDLFGEAYPRGEDQDEEGLTARERYAVRWKEVEHKLRDLEQSLETDDYAGAARDGAKDLRETLKRYF